jgi:hypothetical protein
MFFYVDGGCSRISVSTSQGAHRRYFYIDGGYSRISISTSQGAHRRCFLALMVGPLGSTAPIPPKGLVIDVS